MKLDGQVGVSEEAHKIMTKMSERSNQKAPFNTMADAFLFAFILGLRTGNKTSATPHQNYANFSTIENAAGNEELDFVQLLTHLGKTSDVESKENAMQAIEEYATWGLLKMEEYDRGESDYRMGDLMDSIFRVDEKEE